MGRHGCQPPLSAFTQPRSSGRSSNSVLSTTVLVVLNTEFEDRPLQLPDDREP